MRDALTSYRLKRFLGIQSADIIVKFVKRSDVDKMVLVKRNITNSSVVRLRFREDSQIFINRSLMTARKERCYG